ncbi:unnamed protein product [Calypogeia fissa]
MVAQSMSSTMLEVVVLVVLGLLSMNAVSASTTYAVKWGIPPNLLLGELHQNNMLVVGDVLHFEYSSMHHDVLEVTPEHFAECNNSAPVHKWTDGNSMVTMSEPGTFHFICDFPGHCEAGQVLVVNVKAPQESGAMASAPSHSIETKTISEAEALTPSAEEPSTRSEFEAPSPSSEPKEENMESEGPSPSSEPKESKSEAEEPSTSSELEAPSPSAEAKSLNFESQAQTPSSELTKLQSEVETPSVEVPSTTSETGTPSPSAKSESEALTPSVEAPSSELTKLQSEVQTPSVEVPSTTSQTGTPSPSAKSESEALTPSVPTTHNNAPSAPPTPHTKAPSPSPSTHTNGRSAAPTTRTKETAQKGNKHLAHDSAHAPGPASKGKSGGTIQQAALQFTWCIVPLVWTLWINKVLA